VNRLRHDLDYRLRDTFLGRAFPRREEHPAEALVLRGRATAIIQGGAAMFADHRAGEDKMSDLGHDLHSAFPEDGEILMEFKQESPHFQSLWQRYHDLARPIGRIEGGLDAASDDRLEEMKKQRLAILDEIAGMIAERKAG
jgi:uncharacterized protein YdcH (DUF465 family)